MTFEFSDACIYMPIPIRIPIILWQKKNTFWPWPYHCSFQMAGLGTVGFPRLYLASAWRVSATSSAYMDLAAKIPQRCSATGVVFVDGSWWMWNTQVMECHGRSAVRLICLKEKTRLMIPGIYNRLSIEMLVFRHGTLWNVYLDSLGTDGYPCRCRMYSIHPMYCKPEWLRSIHIPEFGGKCWDWNESLRATRVWCCPSLLGYLYPRCARS